ncbi:wall-associated receptor kinase 2-like [Argentina anserina]|uniref:wall-associated receptor kinase 2-like n=1 Tax=Argentina anserina TaxID=57926 RepID=UPI0021766126|nr:wall-associated receptor kinase 2-like [Potentilla anserina]
MAVHVTLVMQLSVMALLLPVILAAADQALLPQALPGCTDRCGDLVIPYPFGIGEGCYLRKEFQITCDRSTRPPSANWTDSNVHITNFWLAEGELQIMSYTARDCYDQQGKGTNQNSPELTLVPPYTISPTKNKFIAVGCDTYAIFTGYRGEERYITGCMSLCNSFGSLDGSCSGVGCCQTSIPSGMKNRTVTLSSYYNHSDIWSFNPCSYAFIVQEGHFNFSNTSFQELKVTEQVPMVLDWAIGNEPDSCDAAEKKQDFACKKNSKCVNHNNKNGYVCQCLPGYEGNPYLPDGCQDIDNCKDSNPCKIGKCVNSPPGNYSCFCPKGYINDIMDEKNCIKENHKNQSKTTLLLVISLSVSLGFLVMLVGISMLYWAMKKRDFIKLKENYFRENGGLLLQQKLSSQGMKTAKLYGAEELEKATNYYHASTVLGEGSYGTVYKGILDNKEVAIKKSKIGARSQIDQFVNEVIIVSQINHRNVVRLLGCCLETEVPLLVYEFISRGTLSEHIHKEIKGASLSLDLRLKIAAETAGALAYLHSSISMPVIHRDVKSSNILLDENYTAKVSDFGASRMVPLDQNQLSTLVQGTLGYLDPEYLLTNQLTEKSDVYSFGVVLVELITGKVALTLDRREEERSLASLFVRSIQEDHLKEIIDDDIVDNENVTQTLRSMANLAKRCLRLKGEERPNMKEVATELDGMRTIIMHLNGQADFGSEETENLETGEGNYGLSSAITSTTSWYDSMQKQMLMPYDDGR